MTKIIGMHIHLSAVESVRCVINVLHFLEVFELHARGRIVVAVHAGKREGLSRAMLATVRPSCYSTVSIGFVICKLCICKPRYMHKH